MASQTRSGSDNLEKGQGVESRFVMRRGWRKFSALVAIAALAVAGCVGATAVGSPSLLPVASPAETTFASASPATATASPAVEPAATAAATDLPIVPLAPSGTWKSIRWVSEPATPLLASPTDTPDAPGVQTYSSTRQLFGWSGGFVGLSFKSVGMKGEDKVTTTTATTYSNDGVLWHAGPGVQQQTSDPLVIRGVFEGPDGLLAVEETTACGDSWVEGLLTSSDGVTWQAVDMGKAFGNAVVWNVSGGSTGFVATDTVGHAVWISRDGRIWESVKLDAPVFATSRIDDGTAFSAGYVLVGSTQTTGARSCSGPPSPIPPLRVPTVWSSSDGAAWVKAPLPGAKAEYTIQMSVQRLDDHTLAAFANYGSDGVWVSNDGRTWRPLAKPVTLDQFISNYYYCQSEGCFMTDGRHGIQLEGLNATLDNPYGDGMSLSTWTDSGLITLAQSGDQPPYDFGTDWAVGPTGVVVTDAGQLWIGLPSSN